MSEKWYCPACGPINDTNAWGECPRCLDDAVREYPAFFTTIQARISELEAIIEMLPHGDECLLVFNTITDRWEIETCNCPKSKIGSK